jgi:hypothetical protein
VKILLLPGLGDVHWTLLKLRSFLAKQGFPDVTPEIWLWDIDNRPRTIEYFDLVPWALRGGYFKGHHKEIFNRLYMAPGLNYVRDFVGFDYVIGLNGDMRNGVPFSEILDGAECDHDYGPRFSSEKEIDGDYFVLCFSDLGMFKKHWADRVGVKNIKHMLLRLKQHFPNHKFLLTGCEWDMPFTRKIETPDTINLVGKTDLVKFLGLLRHASAYIGWCGGNSILSQHLLTPTIVWWSKTYFPKHDRTGWQHPKARHLVLETEHFDLRATVPQILKMLKQEQ